MTEPTHSKALSPDFIAMLRCPLTRSPLRQDGDFLVAEVGGLRYPIRDGIPVMLIEEAKLPPPFKSLDEFKGHFTNCIAP
ncbi:MAG: Trm112 family protein [Planctomycetota bacterium]|nr:Trm112 family protein [Planctomycetota bacterium]